MNRNRLILIAVLALGAVLLATLALRGGALAPRPEIKTEETGKAAIGGDFALVDQDGRPVTQDALKGKWSAVFFGFTYCPDVCPATLQALSGAAEQLTPRQRQDLQIVFISVDPERDNPAQMKTYLAAQDLAAPALGLTGSPEQVARAAKAYRVFYEKDGGGESYLVNHSTAAYLMDPNGQFSRVLAYGMTPDQMAVQIADAMRGE